MTPIKDSPKLKKIKAQFKNLYKLNDAQFKYWWNVSNKNLDGLSPNQVSVLPNGIIFLETLYKNIQKAKPKSSRRLK